LDSLIGLFCFKDETACDFFFSAGFFTVFIILFSNYVII